MATEGFALPARFDHPHGRPGVAGRRSGEAETLASCYRPRPRGGRPLGATSVAFPAISTGSYGYPAGPAAAIAVATVGAAGTDVRLVRFVAFDGRWH